MEEKKLRPDLPLIQEADLRGKVVLIRFDHNVVKKGVIRDPYRIDRSIGTLFSVVERGGRPIMMTHIGRPCDKDTGRIECRPEEDVRPIVDYLEQKLHVRFHIPDFPMDRSHGIKGIDASVGPAIRRLKEGKLPGIYLPNTRWFAGEEAEGKERESFARQLAGLADVFINDAFGSWQPHASTVDVTRHLPSYAGYLMQREILNLEKVIDPRRPFVAVVAGAKYDTKIKPLYALYEKVDRLILGGVIYNTYLCARYGVSIQGVSEGDIRLAGDLVARDEKKKKIVELPGIVESETLERKEGHYRTVFIRDFKAGDAYHYILDIDPSSFRDPLVGEAINSAATVFVNAVMGYTPHFFEGSQALDNTIDSNTRAMKMYGGGDTLQEFKSLCPGLYLSVMDNASYYFFTGGGTVLKAIEQGNPYGLAPVMALMESALEWTA